MNPNSIEMIGYFTCSFVQFVYKVWTSAIGRRDCLFGDRHARHISFALNGNASSSISLMSQEVKLQKHLLILSLFQEKNKNI